MRPPSALKGGRLRARSAAGLMCVLAVSCGGDEAVRVPDRVAESLPRASRILLRDAEQAVIIAQAELDDLQRQFVSREREVEAARRSGRGSDLREAEITLAGARLAVARADVEQAKTQWSLARARRDQTHAEVLLRHEMISSGSAGLPERRKQVLDLAKEMDEQITHGRKVRADLDKVARRRDELLDRDLVKTIGRAGPPWTE